MRQHKVYWKDDIVVPEPEPDMDLHCSEVEGTIAALRGRETGRDACALHRAFPTSGPLLCPCDSHRASALRQH